MEHQGFLRRCEWPTNKASLQTVKLWSLLNTSQVSLVTSLVTLVTSGAGEHRELSSGKARILLCSQSFLAETKYFQTRLLGGGIYLGHGFIGFNPSSCGPGYVGRMESMEGELFHLMVDRKEGWRKRGREYIPNIPPHELLPPTRPHFLNFPPVPTHHHQLGTRYLRQEPVGDISYSTYNNICLHLDPGIYIFFKTRRPLRLGHKRKKVKDIRGQITNSVPYIEVFRHMQRLRKQPKGRSIL